MSDNRKIDPPPAFAADEAQPSSAIDEHNALSEREDGTNTGGGSPAPTPSAADAYPTIRLSEDEQQPLSALAEHEALSEGEEGPTRGECVRPAAGLGVSVGASTAWRPRPCYRRQRRPAPARKRSVRL